MNSNRRRRWIKLGLLLRENAWVLGVIGAWFTVNFLIFRTLLHLKTNESLLVLFFFNESPTAWGRFYRTISDVVIFGLIVSAIAVDIFRKYRPEETCRRLAGECRDHVIIVGYSHFGERIAEYLSSHDVPVVILEADRSLVEGLIRLEYPLVLGSGADESALAATSVSYARMIAITTEDLTTASVACALTRQSNKTCKLICRCYDDDVGAVLSKTYNAVVFSTSKFAADFVSEYAEQKRTKRSLIIGCDHFGRRLIDVMKKRKIDYVVIEDDRSNVEDLLDEEPILLGQPSDPDLLEKAHVSNADLVILTKDDLGENLIIIDRIRDANRTCRIVCRVFQEEAGNMLEQDPFQCAVVSTSQFALDSLIKDGVFRDVTQS